MREGTGRGLAAAPNLAQRLPTPGLRLHPPAAEAEGLGPRALEPPVRRSGPWHGEPRRRFPPTALLPTAGLGHGLGSGCFRAAFRPEAISLQLVFVSRPSYLCCSCQVCKTPRMLKEAVVRLGRHHRIQVDRPPSDFPSELSSRNSPVWDTPLYAILIHSVGSIF